MNDYQPVGQGNKSGMKFRYIFALMLLTFVGGAIASVWAANTYDLFGKNSANTALPYLPPAIEAKPAFDVLSPDSNSAIPNVDPVAQRVDDLEERLSRINADAAAASGNANRAEGMLIAFAARRAIDSGADLGYIGRQLSQRFGTVQPQAVAQILGAARQPVTLDKLRGELLANGNAWTTPPGMTAWAKFRREIGELFILRHETTPSPAPARRFERAKQYTEVGNVAAAMAEVRNLPGSAQAAGWIANATNYVAARTALYQIERAALARPAPPPTALPAPATLLPAGPEITPANPFVSGPPGDQTP